MNENKPQGRCCMCEDSKRKLYLIGLFGCVICGVYAREYGLI